jgi:hypothetical protein
MGMKILETIRELYNLIAVSQPKAGSVKNHTKLARQLSKIVKREKPWGWRYVQSVAKGTVQPSKDMRQAVDRLALAMDGTPAMLADVEEVTVVALRGSLQAGALVLPKSQLCQQPGCRITFVPRVPWQKYCGVCKRSRRR